MLNFVATLRKSRSGGNGASTCAAMHMTISGEAPLRKRPVIGALDAGLFEQWKEWLRRTRK